MFTKIIPVLLLACVCSVSAFKIKATQASGGEDHTLIQSSTSQLAGCGENSNWQLGLNNTDDSPVLLNTLTGQQNSQDGYLSDIASFDAGWLHSIACDTNGFCWTWGSNSNFCLGVGNSSTPAYTPVQVWGGQQGGAYLQDIIQVSAGRSGTHSLAIEGETGRCFAFGNNGSGQLGINSIDVSKSVPWIVLCRTAAN